MFAFALLGTQVPSMSLAFWANALEDSRRRISKLND